MDPLDPSLPVFTGWHTIEKLGEGGMCSVYRGRAPDGTERALKMLNDTSQVSIRRFVDEAALLQRIDHPNVVRVHALAKDELPPWLVMDLLAGRDLDETMRLEGRMDPERAAQMFADLASGLAAVHAAGVRHRDLKPANIRIGGDGIARLIDFGIARDAASARRTRQGFVVGTASYLPPEVFAEDDKGRNVQDSETADVYALGQTLCEMLAGAPIHDPRAATAAGAIVRVMKDKLEREQLDPRDLGAKVPEELCQVVRRATKRDPAVRTPTARAFEADLRRWLQLRHSSGMVAPITRADLSLVPVPTVPPTSIAPREPRSATPAPAPARARGWMKLGAVGAMGMAGIGMVVLGLVILAALGVAALLAFAPAHGAEPTGAAEVQHRFDALGSRLRGCPPESSGARIALTVAEGRTQRVEVSSPVERRAERCLERVLLDATWPVTPSPVSLVVTAP